MDPIEETLERILKEEEERITRKNEDKNKDCIELHTTNVIMCK